MGSGQTQYRENFLDGWDEKRLILFGNELFNKIQTNTMKSLLVVALGMVVLFFSGKLSAQNYSSDSNAMKSAGKSLFIDVHDLTPGKVTFADVMAAHQKDLATEGKYDVTFIKFWVDEQRGKVYCLSSAKDSASVVQTHREAHGLLPSAVYKVSYGTESPVIEGEQFFLDVHILGGPVTAEAVAQAHQKDLAVEKKYGVNFIDYWVDEKNGRVFCLSQAPDSNAIKKTHQEAHGLLPAYVLMVKQGQ
jgi:hypothetical protein